MSPGLPVGAPDRRHDRHGRPRKGRPWGGVRAGAAAGGSPSVPFKGAAGPWSRAYHWHVCWAGVPRAPDRQQRAAALAGGHLVGRSLDTTTPSRTGPTGRFSWAAAWQAGVAGPRARVSRAVVPWRACGDVGALGGLYRQVATARTGGDSNGRKPSSAAARLGRCGPRDRPAADRRPGARLDQGLGVCSSTGSLRSR